MTEVKYVEKGEPGKTCADCKNYKDSNGVTGDNRSNTSNALQQFIFYCPMFLCISLDFLLYLFQFFLQEYVVVIFMS